ncbi:unnamed protein product, partial [Adineta steineri]
EIVQIDDDARVNDSKGVDDDLGVNNNAAGDLNVVDVDVVEDVDDDR